MEKTIFWGCNEKFMENPFCELFFLHLYLKILMDNGNKKTSCISSSHLFLFLV